MNPIFNIESMLVPAIYGFALPDVGKAPAARHSGASSRLRLANDYIGNFGEKKSG